jgi:hypothetical protein
MRFIVTTLAAVAVAVAALLALPAPAAAQDSCYDHNGSVMRYSIRGNGFVVTYERPRAVLRRAGVRSGTLLVDGRFSGHQVTATARRFSRHCPGRPLEYTVSGWFEGENPDFVLEGSRPVYARCRPTGRTAYDVLRFHYLGPC